jgi:hypothetical protein
VSFLTHNHDSILILIHLHNSYRQYSASASFLKIPCCSTTPSYTISSTAEWTPPWTKWVSILYSPLIPLCIFPLHNSKYLFSPSSQYPFSNLLSISTLYSPIPTHLILLLVSKVYAATEAAQIRTFIESLPEKVSQKPYAMHSIFYVVIIIM